jgi:hypothetical protein
MSMATRSFNDPIEPMDLANMRATGVRSLDVQCLTCRHPITMNVDHLPGDLVVPSLGPKMVCTKCGMDRRRRAAELAGEGAVMRLLAQRPARRRAP